MATTEPPFQDLVQRFETALSEYKRLGETSVHPTEYIIEGEVMTLTSIERYREVIATYAQAGQNLALAKEALDAWFPAPVIAAFDRGVALVAPADQEIIVLVRHNDSYLIERGTTQEEALNKIERFLNQF